MTLKKIIINGNTYSYYNPDTYNDFILYQKQIKRVREKLRATKNGCYKDMVTKQGHSYYSDYEELLSFLEGLMKEKQE